MSDATLYEETFTITTLTQDKYDRVTRVIGASKDSATALSLDVNHELYRMSAGDEVSMLLATTLNLDGTKDERGWRDKKGEQTLADMYDYVCYGKVYRFEEGEEGKTIKCYVSFGGLLLCLDGPHKKLSPLRIDHVYMLLKK
nr:hypothetical protein B0A51_09804 [Rachicladosporium sp. CCFEE 5018]